MFQKFDPHSFVLTTFVWCILIALSMIGVVDAQAPSITYTSPQNFTTGKKIDPVMPSNSGGAVPATIYGQVTTYAGTGAAGAANGKASAASFNDPIGITNDASGNIYITDEENFLIRKIDAGDNVTTLAGGATQTFPEQNGAGANACFNGPYDAVIGKDGNIYVADLGGNTIRKVTPTGVVTTFAGSGATGSSDGTGTLASFNGPSGLAVDAAGNIYVVENFGHKIRKINPAGVVTTIAGTGSPGSNDGNGVSASFNYPVRTTTASGYLYVTDYNNNSIRKISQAGQVTTLAGNGAGYADGTTANASFHGPDGIVIDLSGNLYVCDWFNNRIREVTPQGTVSTFAGDGTAATKDGIGTKASFDGPFGLTQDAMGNLYVGETSNFIRKIVTTGYTISAPLPPGLSFNNTTGVITGTPTTEFPATEYTITAYNATGSSSFIIIISATAPAGISTPPANSLIYIPNTFTPNGDGVNDTWNITALSKYPNCVVNVFDRYGALLFHSVGYGHAWDGTYNGKAVPVGTYYYLIDTMSDPKYLSGWVAILR